MVHPKPQRSPQQPKQLQTQRLHALKRSECLLKDNSFHSQIFYIRYAEEIVSPYLLTLQVDLSEMVTFKTEVESLDNFVLRVELMFMEATEEDIRMPLRTQQTSHPETPQNRHPFEEEGFVQRHFKMASRRQYKLNFVNGEKRGSYYLRVPFDQAHLSCVSLTLHSALTGKSCLSDLQTSNPPRFRSQDSSSSIIPRQGRTTST